MNHQIKEIKRNMLSLKMMGKRHITLYKGFPKKEFGATISLLKEQRAFI